MNLKEVQIVCFDNPYPPNFGGVMDVFFKIEALYELGIKIHLHYFYTERKDLGPLNKYCKSIFGYKRNKSYIHFFKKYPFGVVSRSSDAMYKNLNLSNAPILFEGLQSTHILNSNHFKNKIIVRTHNIEHFYYKGLAKSAKSFLLKGIFYLEASKYKKYEKILSKVNCIIPISKSENHYFKEKYSKETFLLPPFHGNNTLKSSEEEVEKFAFYHGDLSISDNLKSALFIANEFSKITIPLIIGGSVLPASLKKIINQFSHISFINIKEQNKLNNLLKKAHINILWSFQQSGTKLKVFTALYNGKHCIINKNITDNLSIKKICTVVNSGQELKDAVTELNLKEFKIDPERKQILTNYSNLSIGLQLKLILDNIS